MQRGLVVCVMLALSVGFALQVMVYDRAYLYGENQLMEHIQLAILFIVAAVFFLKSSKKAWQPVAAAAPALRLLALMAVALCFSFIVREMSVKKTQMDWLIFIVDGQGFKLLMLLIWLPLLTMAYQHKAQYISIVKQGLFSTSSLYLVAAATLLSAGGLFDKEVIVVEYFRFYEELLEMNGYGLMLVAALHFQRDMLQVVCNQCQGEMDVKCHELLNLQRV